MSDKMAICIECNVPLKPTEVKNNLCLACFMADQYDSEEFDEDEDSE